MAPEQADLNAMPDAKWDVYAMGAILYCMLTGEPPYYSSERLTTLRTAKDLPERLSKYRTMLQHSPSPKLHYKVPGVDKSLANIVDCMLAPLPQDRFENVQQVIDALVQRDAQRLRKPLTLLGIVGPLLLLAVMSIFFWRGISTAKQQSTMRLQQEAKQSNSFAARLAARTMEGDIAALYQLVEEECGRGTLLKNMEATTSALDDAQWRNFIAHRPPKELYTQLIENDQRRALESYLQTAYDRLNSADNKAKHAASIDSMFVLDAYGTMIATAFETKVENTKVGYNFAFRSYYNGQIEDGDQAGDHSQFSAYPATHLSPPFLSTTTGNWKIAISSPIWKSSSETTDESKDSTVEQRALIGVLVVTINLGDFRLLTDEVSTQAQSKKSRVELDEMDRFAVLVDGRRGSHEGDLVQHPLLGEIAEQLVTGSKEAPDVASVSLRIDSMQLAALRKDGLLNYQDPAAKHPLGKHFRGDWIAALETIRLPIRHFRTPIC